ncbi:UNKNOWN [Stylonychia lemnae]|uniref:PAS domain-containing protein n=1 Tax=Stylonychia lemnae TaxID=5949 RepID=A0A077ZWP5_STYLE|nr:UNKNOWN [Stylonychia lemnae]|eukprot:CDW74269.1 UNKNOWN [Stylonychia lemnae]
MFAFEQAHNCFLAINLLRSFDSRSFSTLEKINYKINEAYQIYLILKVIQDRRKYQNGYKHKQYGVVLDEQQILKGSYQNGSIPDYIGEDNIEPDHFIQDVMEFWRSFLGNNHKLDVKSIKEKSDKVAERVLQVQQLFQKINLISKYADQKLYHCYALVQKLLINDIQSYELYMNKMKSLINMQLLFKNNNKQFYSDTDLGVVLVNSFSPDFGKIISANQILMKVLGFTPADLKHARISAIQPKIVKENHVKFVNRFVQTGDSNLIHSNSNLFAIHKNGYAAPYQINVLCHYSLKHGHTLIVFVSPIFEIQLQKNGPKMSPYDLMYFLTDKNGVIQEVSEKVYQILGITPKHLNTYEVNGEEGDYLNISDIIPDLTLKNLENNVDSEQKDKSNVFEFYFNLDLEVMNNLKYQNQKDFAKSRKIKALAVMFQEIFSLGICQMNIIAVQLFVCNNDHNKFCKFISNQKNFRQSVSSNKNFDAQLLKD